MSTLTNGQLLKHASGQGNYLFSRTWQLLCVPQAKAVLKFVEAISEKTLRSTVTLTAARGRGKSAALGLAIASAVAFG